MTSKYRNVRTTVDNKTFDSKGEARRWRELCMLLEAGVISCLQWQPSFELQKPFVYQGKRERAITYVADFMYLEEGVWVVEDYKGKKTAVYLLKRKLFLAKYGHLYEFREVEA